MSLCRAMVMAESLDATREYGIKADMLVGDAVPMFEFVLQHFTQHGVVPQWDTVERDARLSEQYESLDPPDEPASYYAQRIVDREALKIQKEKASELARALKDRRPRDVMEAAKELLSECSLRFDLGDGRVEDLQQSGPVVWQQYQESKRAPGGMTGIPGPWPSINQETCGFQPGDLVTIAARLGVGKTCCALLHGIAASEADRRVAFVSMEVETAALRMRRVSTLLRLPYTALRRGELEEAGERKLQEYCERKPDPDDPAFLVAPAGRIKDLVDIELFLDQSHADLLIVDGAYLMRAGGPKAQRHEHTELAYVGLKRLASRRGICIITTAQFNRTIRKGALQAANENIAHSDAIGQNSTIVLGLLRDESLLGQNEMLVSIMKIREGVPCDIVVRWNFETMDFSELRREGDTEKHSDVHANGGDGDGNLPF